jgi:hypothetical protein
MVNPIPNNWHTLGSTSKFRRQSTIRNDQCHDQNPQEAKQEQYFVHLKVTVTPRVRAIVFDTMVDDTWQSAHQSAGSSAAKKIRRQETIRYEDDLLHQTPPEQYFIHSQHRTSSSSWLSNVKEFLASSRTLQNDDDDDDALYWCE